MTGNFDFIHSRGMDIVLPINLQTVKKRRDCFCLIIFHMLYVISIVMAQGVKNMDSYVPRVIEENYKKEIAT